MEVYGLDPGSGAVEFAVDRGPYSAQQYPAQILMDRLDEEIVLVGFFCRSITLFDLFDPRYLLTLDHLQLLDAGREAALPNYGFSLPPSPREARRYHTYYSTVGADVEKVAVALVPAGTAVKLTMTTGRYGFYSTARRRNLRVRVLQRRVFLALDAAPGKLPTIPFCSTRPACKIWKPMACTAAYYAVCTTGRKVCCRKQRRPWKPGAIAPLWI